MGKASKRPGKGTSQNDEERNLTNTGQVIIVLHNGAGEKIRLHGIDCPEKRQAFGNRAEQFTSKLVFGQTVTVQVVDRDRYGRTVGEVLLPDGRSLNRELSRRDSRCGTAGMRPMMRR